MLQYNITSESNQNFIIVFEDKNIEIDLEFLSIPSCWKMDITYDDETIIEGLKLNSAIFSLETFNLPFDFYVNDVNNIGLSPFDLYSFSDELYTFNLISRLELNELRGYEVE